MTRDDLAYKDTYQTLIDIYCEEREALSDGEALRRMACFAVYHGPGTIDEAAKVLAEHFAGKVVQG